MMAPEPPRRFRCRGGMKGFSELIDPSGSPWPPDQHLYQAHPGYNTPLQQPPQVLLAGGQPGVAPSHYDD